MGRYSLVSQFGGNLAGRPVPVVGNVDLDDLLLVVRTGGTVRTAAAKGDALASGWSWRVAGGGGAVKDETALHGCGEEDEKEVSEARGRRGKSYTEERSEMIVV